MSPLFYKFLHHIGLLLTFIGVGGIGALALAGQANSKARTPFVALHGAGLLVVLVAGFGWLAKLPYGSLPVWAILKLILWLGLGAIVVPIRKQPNLARPLALGAVPAMGILAVIIGVWHVMIFGG